jgi:hypothetical protein
MKKSSNISTNNFVALLLCSIVFVFAIVCTIYRNDNLNNGETTILNAEIIDKYRKRHRGMGFDISSPELRCKYYLNNKEYNANFRFSEEKWDNVNIGDCIEIKVSIKNNHIYEWNETKGAFKCN